MRFTDAGASGPPEPTTGGFLLAVENPSEEKRYHDRYTLPRPVHFRQPKAFTRQRYGPTDAGIDPEWVTLLRLGIRLSRRGLYGSGKAGGTACGSPT